MESFTLPRDSPPKKKTLENKQYALRERTYNVS